MTPFTRPQKIDWRGHQNQANAMKGEYEWFFSEELPYKKVQNNKAKSKEYQHEYFRKKQDAKKSNCKKAMAGHRNSTV